MNWFIFNEFGRFLGRNGKYYKRVYGEEGRWRGGREEIFM